jgi:hypothetical protein
VNVISFYSGSYLHLMMFILTHTYLNMASESSKKRTNYDEFRTFQFREGKVCELRGKRLGQHLLFKNIFCQSDSLVKASCVVVGIIAKNRKLFRKVNLFKNVLNLLLTYTTVCKNKLIATDSGLPC